MINEDKDSSLIKNIKSPSTILTAVLDRTAKKINLQIENCEQYLGGRIWKYKIFNPISKTPTDGTVVREVKNSKIGENAKIENFIILDNGQGVLFKRTEVMLLKIKSEGSRKGRNSSLFGENIPKLKSADKDINSAAQNSFFIENVQKCTKSILGTFSILKNSRSIFMYSSTGGGDSRGLTVSHGEKVDSKLLDIYENLQFETLGRSVSSAVLAMLHTICSICRLRYTNGSAMLLVVTCLHAPARIILLIIMLSAVVCRFYIPCITVNPPIDRYYGSDQSMIPDSELRVVVSETDGAVLSLARYPYGTSLMMGSSRRLRVNRVLTIDRPVGHSLHNLYCRSHKLFQ